MRRWILCSIFCVLLLITSRFAAAERVAVMVHRPSNRLAWNHVSKKAAFMLGIDRILNSFYNRTPAIRRVGAYHVNGVVRGMKDGLYFPQGDTIYEKWSPLIEADVYVECDMNERGLQWKAGNAEGEEFESKVIPNPYQHPMACAAALVELVFESTGTEVPAEWREQLHKDEPSPPQLFIEWAQWIGYRPHWLHHAPWEGPQRSAKRILKDDPQFYRGANWALRMLMRVPKKAEEAPATIFYLPQALKLLDSPYTGSANRFLRKKLKDEAMLRKVIPLFGLDELDLAAQLEVDVGSKTTGPGIGKKTLDLSKLQDTLTGPRFRRNLVTAIGPLRAESARKALLTIAANDEDAGVRAAAAGVLGEHYKETGDALGDVFEADESGEVRAAALRGLAKQKELKEDRVKTAAEDPASSVRLVLAEVLPKSPIDTEQKRKLWMQLLEDEDAEVRAASIRQLRKHTELVITDPKAKAFVERALKAGSETEKLIALRWIRQENVRVASDRVATLLRAEKPSLRAEAAECLAAVDPDRSSKIIDVLKNDEATVVQKAVAQAMADVGTEKARRSIFSLLKRADPAARSAICAAAYRLLVEDRVALARAMRFDPSMSVNLASMRLAGRVMEDGELQDFLPDTVREHNNEYIRARALRRMHEKGFPDVHDLCMDVVESPYWVLRLEAADILADIAQEDDAEKISALMEEVNDEWLHMALEDALRQAEGRPKPERVELNLGETEHTPGGDTPYGFQTWLGRMPEDKEKTREMVDQGYRFGVKNFPANMPGGMVLNTYNRTTGARNIYLLESILDPLENKWKDKLPYLYYIALFDEPCSLGRASLRAMLLEAGRPDLLEKVEGLGRKKKLEALPGRLRRAYEWYNAKFGGIGSNWVTHMYRMTAQRKYPDIQIFPQSLSYMRKHTHDAFNMIEADGDYSWIYHNGNYYRDPSIGGVNRVINPGKPLCMIAWMGWYNPRIFNPKPLCISSNWKLKPWRMREYFGTRSGLALWASGTEAGFFPHIGFAKESKKDEKGYHGMSTLSFRLKPWSDHAKKAVEYMLDDDEYWEVVEGRLDIEKMNEKREDDGLGMMAPDEDEGMDIPPLEEGPTPKEKKLKEKREKLYEKLMTGVSYMNIFNLDNTRALSNLPKPDTSLRDTLLIMGRDISWWADGSFFKMPAEAIVQGWDLVPNYDCIGDAELTNYDTILLRSSNDGVTSELVERINQWLRNKKDGLLIVGGDCTSDKVLFPSLTLDEIDAPFLWENDIAFHVQKRVKQTYKDRRGRKRTRKNWPAMKELRKADGELVKDPVSRLHNTISGEVKPLITTKAGKAILARWKAPPEVKSVVLFDGAYPAGPEYTAALEKVILRIDEERGSDVKRNHWWGHTIYENDKFVVDVATSQLHMFHKRRPRQHKGVDIITGVINPEVRHRESALILKDYVGPYAGGKGDWAVMAREALKEMKVKNPGELYVEADGVTRISHIGPEPIKLEDATGFEEVENQVLVWKMMREGTKAYSQNEVNGGRELHVYSPDPFTVLTGSE
ncbi:MAG: HEAT repeat domain-containing protein [Candidatus Brocadiia bacterium]